MGVRTQASFFTAGGVWSFTGWKAQKARSSSVIGWPGARVLILVPRASSGHGAFISTQRVRSAISRSLSLPAGGILILPS